MDDINNFFDLSKDFKREVLPAPRVHARMTPKAEPVVFKREVIGTDYGEEYRKAELEDMKKIAAELESKPQRVVQSLNDVEMDDLDDENVSTKMVDDVYNRYNFTRNSPDLPIVEMESLILKTIEENSIVILEGATGCGKTTQVPQFILDDAYRKRKSVNIVVTQPRRIAAVSIANRVSKERNLGKLPNLIGYQIGLKVETNADTRIMYCTTGVLLEKLVASKTLINYTHIILDEVHERSQNMDFLFIVIKQLRITAPHVKIILMSATIEANAFAEYFSSYRGGPRGTLTPAPIIKVDKKSNFTIKEFYLDDLARLKLDMSTRFEYGKAELSDEMYLTALKLILITNRIDYMDNLQSNKKSTILIFLPGIYEINCMVKHIMEAAAILQDEPIIALLHSMISQSEQEKAMKTPPPGKRLIILATNIAESSITVPGVKFVIDFCLTKNNVTDTTTNFTSLQLEWCSRSNCRQRAGRTGRTMDGRVYRLVTRDFYENHMDESSKPEMCRCPLEDVVLKAKQLNMGPPCKIIALAMDRPTKYDIENTILLLKESGALLRTLDGHYSDEDGDMTFIGHVMAALPVNIFVAKLIALGYCYSVLRECIIIGAGLTTKSIFEQGMKNVVRFYSKKLTWSDGSGSDLLAILKAYNAYVSYEQQHGSDSAKKWTDRYYLNIKSLLEMKELIKEITERLNRLGIRESTSVNRTTWSSAEKSIILKVVIAGAFYPNYFVRSSSEMLDRETSRVINGRNPCNTIYFTGFEQKYVRPLYVRSIKKALMPCTNSPDNMQVTFDGGNEKVFVSFKQTNASMDANADTDLDVIEMGPGQVSIEVYKALKMRKSSKPIELRVMHPKDAQAYAEKMKIGSFVSGEFRCTKNTIKNFEMFCLPRKHVKSVTGTITHYNTNGNRFWLRPVDEERLFNQIQLELNSLNRDIEEFSSHNDVHAGQVVAASYDGSYYRAKVLSVIRGTTKVYYNVLLMDIGVEGDVEFSELRRLRGVSAQYIDVPARVFECRLACIEPSELHSERYGWKSTMTEFKRLTCDGTVCAEIYSVENGIVNVFIYVHDRTVQDILIEEGFARTSDENFMSKVDHDMRVRCQEQRNNVRFEEECDAIEEEMRKMLPMEDALEVEEPELSRRHITVKLKGPLSPLESQINTCMHQPKSQPKRVVIEHNSVNSILLEANPQETFEKYIVAVNVTENQKKTEITARETTIMPNIPGFGPLMALIFSPYCEFMRDTYKSRYIAIICGLGEHPKNKQPINGERDTVFNLDCEIDVTDIENINTIRFIMDSLFQFKADQRHLSATEFQQNQLMAQMKTAIINLLEKDRPLMGIQSRYGIGWSKYHPNDQIKAIDVFSTKALFPFHNILTLAAEDSPDRLNQLHSLTENNKELHRVALTDATLRRAIRCQLCHMDLDSVTALKIHLYTRLHTDREKKISLVN